MNITFKKRIVRRSYPNIHLHIMFGHFKKSVSILTDQDMQWSAMTDDRPLFATLGECYLSQFKFRKNILHNALPIKIVQYLLNLLHIKGKNYR